MNTIQQLALDILIEANKFDDEEFEIAVQMTELILPLLFKHGYTTENLVAPLAEEYGRMVKQDNESIIKDFFG